MATLKRIKICGIRSFGCDEEDVQTVSFHKPMTLILGENGCGKSTIIECLRYLTAQKEPSGKGTFVHDPSLTERATVRGFVKLKLKDVKGAVVDLCRQVQVTRTKRSLTTKSLDNVITRTNSETKEKVSISNRCADFSYEISRIFGVSRAILEHVIFCTQEDSHWPLDTDQKLKEKFDQIFDSDKYNKCVSKVREKRKKIKDVLKNSEVELKYLKENRGVAVEKRRKIKKTKKQVEECSLQIQGLNLSLEEVENKLKEINEKELHMTKNHSMKEMKKAELKGIEEGLAELNSRIHHKFPGSDEELKEEIRNFSELSSARQKEVADEEENIKKFNSEESKYSSDLMKEQGMLGQLLREDELNQERVEERNFHLTELASDLKIPVSSQLNSQDSVQNLMEKVKEKVFDEEDELEKTKLMLIEEEQDLQSNIDKLREECLIAQNDVFNKEKNLQNCRTEGEKINKELNEMNQSTKKLAELQSSLSKVNKELKEFEESVSVENLKETVKTSIEERNKLEERVSEIEEEVKEFQQKSGLATELNLQVDLKSSKDSQFRRLINKHEENFRGLLGDVPESGFKAAMQSRIESARQKVKELTGLQSKKEKELTELEMKRKHVKEKLRAKEEALRGDEEEIYEVCGGNDFEGTVALTRKQLEDLQDVKGTLSSSEFMYQKFIRALHKAQPCCPLCHRDFEQQTEAQSLVDELMSKVREVPSRLNDNKIQLEEKQIKYNKLLGLRSKYDQIFLLKEKEIPNLRSEFEKTEEALKKVQTELNDLEGEVYSPQADLAICITLQEDAVLMDQLQLERTQLGAQIEKVKKELGSGGGDKDAFKKKLNEQDTTRQKLKTVRQRVEEFQAKLTDFNEQLQVKQATKNSLMEEVNKIQGGSAQRPNLTEKLDELKAEEAVFKVELNELKKKLETVRKQMQDAIDNKIKEKNKNAEMIEKMTYSVTKLKNKLHDIEGESKLIEAHERKRINERIEVVQQTMGGIEKEINNLKTKREKAAKKINEIRRSLSNQELRERELEDNLRYRQKSLEAKNLKTEVNILEEKFGNTNFDAILKDKRRFKSMEEEIGKTKAQIQGRLVEMESQIEALESELLSNMFRTVDEDYNKQYLKSEILKAIGVDLERYATTMEYAMMTYHKQQMTRVNAFIREYWRKIYQGNDIDYIEIQTDNIESTEKRRNYNYKIVQVKSGAHLDMRNRCSAGQKMLASLIIRLALAETFSSNCGILTLDEPTTNLDRKNIKNLARTLSEVLVSKQSTSNPNFQLIVITHDEEFLQELKDLDMVNKYVKVDRNNKGKTVVSNRVLDVSELNPRQDNRPPTRPYQYD